MKVGWCSSRCLALLLLALLEAVTLVFPQQQRCDDLANTCNTEAMNNVSKSPLRAAGTGQAGQAKTGPLFSTLSWVMVVYFIYRMVKIVR